MPVRIFMDGQFGSCGKGAVISVLAQAEKPDVIVRVGGPQAGHSFYGPCPQDCEGVSPPRPQTDPDHRPLHPLTPCGILGQDGDPTANHLYKQRQVPVAWHSGAMLVIGRGAMVDLDVLEAEIQAMRDAGVQPEGRLFIYPDAFIVEKRHRMAERVDTFGVNGSTKEGVGIARAHAAMRTATQIVDVAQDEAFAWLRSFILTTDVLKDMVAEGANIWIEGTQGFGLSLRASGYYPYVTSADITPQQLLADTGLHWDYGVRTTMLLRTYPIRIAGNSGPLAEIDWSEVENPPAQPEITTVTLKQRRIGRFDMEQVKRAVDECHPDEFVLTFADYLSPESLRNLVLTIEGQTGVPVRYISHGFEDLHERAEYWQTYDLADTGAFA